MLGLCAALCNIAEHVYASVASRQFGGFTIRIAHIVHSLYNSTKGIFILMVPKDLNVFLTFLHAFDTENYVIGPNSWPQKSADKLTIAKSYKNIENNDFCYTMKFPPYRENCRLSTQ